MRRKTLFMIFCIATLTFTGCGKAETPVMSTNVETTTVEETVTEEVETEETTDNVTEEVTISEEIKVETEIPEDILSNENPIQNNNNPDEVVNTETGMTVQETLDKFEELMGGFDDTYGDEVGVGISQEVLDNATVAPDYDKTPAW